MWAALLLRLYDWLSIDVTSICGRTLYSISGKLQQMINSTDIRFWNKGLPHHCLKSNPWHASAPGRNWESAYIWHQVINWSCPSWARCYQVHRIIGSDSSSNNPLFGWKWYIWDRAWASPEGTCKLHGQAVLIPISFTSHGLMHLLQPTPMIPGESPMVSCISIYCYNNAM